MEFLTVTPETLRIHWPRISQSLDAVLAKAEEDWIKEDVYAALRSGGAICHFVVDDTGFAGLMITTRSVAEFSGNQSLHVWIAHNEGSGDVIEAGLGLLRQMAVKGGFSRITFGSPRPGWGKRYKLVSSVYEVSIQ